MEVGVPLTIFFKNLKEESFHPYKMQLLHNINGDDIDHRMETIGYQIQVHTKNIVLFSNEARFYINGEVNTRTIHNGFLIHIFLVHFSLKVV